MAGYWIKVEHLLPDKPEVHAIANELGIDPDAVVGKLVRVWIWADQQLRDGCAPSVTLALLDRLTSAAGFGAAMQSAGWLVVSRKGIAFPNFERHNGQTAKNRGLAAIRMLRSRCAGVTPAPSPKRERQSKSRENPPTPMNGLPGKEPPGAVPDRPEATSALPAALAGEAFGKAWGDWCLYRAERGQPLTPTGAARLLARLAEMGAARACALIDRSIANGYQGLIFTEDNRHDERLGRGDPAPDKYAGVVRPVGGTPPEAAAPPGLAAGEGPANPTG